jgi:hypothetical protein
MGKHNCEPKNRKTCECELLIDVKATAQNTSQHAAKISSKTQPQAKIMSKTHLASQNGLQNTARKQTLLLHASAINI